MLPKGETEDLYTEINVTPLVDVVLVLLIIFMVTIPALIQSEIPLELPEASSGEEPKGTDIGIQILKDGSLRINGVLGTVADLPERIKALTPPVRAMIEADRSVPHGTVIDLLDRLRILGVEKYALAVLPRESP